MGAWRFAFAGIAASCLLIAAAPASAEDGRSFSFTWENDIFGGTDRNYTNGVQLSLVSAPEHHLPFTKFVPRFFALGTEWRAGVTLGHLMFTPADISAVVPDPDDRPYAGWLFAAASLYAVEDLDDWRRLNTAQLELGVVGPSAAGEWVQSNWHKLIDGDEPMGWDHQLHDEPGIVLRLEQSWTREPVAVGPLYADFGFRYGASLGNVDTHAAAGVMVRLGQGLDGDFGPPRIRPSMAGAAFGGDETLGWYFFAGLDARAVGRDIFLDGNTFRDSPSVDKELLVMDAQGGVAVTLGRARVAFTYVHRTESFKGQAGPDRFGAGSISWRF